MTGRILDMQDVQLVRAVADYIQQMDPPLHTLSSDLAEGIRIVMMSLRQVVW